MRLKVIIGLGLLGCSPQEAKPTEELSPTAMPEKRMDEADSPVVVSPSRQRQYAWPTGLLSVLPDPFKRFDGSMLFRVLWPELDNVRFQLAPSDPRVGIGFHGLILPGSKAKGRGRMAAIVLSGNRPDSSTRDARLLIAETQLEPPGPLELVAASAPKSLRVSSEAQFRLVQQGDEWAVHIKDQGSESLHHFVARGAYLMAQPPKKGLNSKTKPRP